MDSELQQAGLQYCARAYLDDVLIHSSDLATHVEHVRAVLLCLQRCGLRVHPGKSTFRHL